MKVDITSRDLKPDERWAMAYTDPNPQHYIVGSVTASTRSAAWDAALAVWFNRLESGGEYWYIPFQPRNGVRTSISRHSALKVLRKKGVRVVRVLVVPA